jgi:AcrR family transcriptional regulator
VLCNKRKPGRPSLSDEQRREIRENIIEIARELFVNEGYENTSMRKIAAQAGFAPTKIYYYFENKKAILRFFWNDISEALWQYCQPPQEVLDGEPIDIVRYLMFKNVHYWLKHPKSYQLGIATQDHRADKNDNFDIYAAPGTSNYINLMHQSVQRCIDQGIFRFSNKKFATQVISLSVYGIYGAFYSLPMVAWEDRDTLINEAIENTLRGLMANP